MRYQQDLQVALRDRLRRLMTATYTAYGHEAALVCDWISNQAGLRAILTDIAGAESDVTVDDWEQACGQAQNLVWRTTTEAGRARLIWEWLKSVAEQDVPIHNRPITMISSERNLNAILREVTESVVMPLFDYLGERIGSESSVLYHLERYVRRVEWFDRDDLHERYTANTRQGEKVYDDHLRRFLFDQGLDMPFSQPKSASGLSDVIGELDTDDPLVCEVKVFDADGHDKRGITSGVHQVIHYAQDYGKSTAYLVVVNLSGRALELPTDGTGKQWPPFVDIAGVRVHLIAVRALPTVSASKMGKARPVAITREDLADPDA
ncbi:hypothetical protein SAMN05660662_1783 [Blastococcus aurantiacus]|uniref:Uncharacterized protein n=2 Tax=Blastococcus aurantiacus TaxID=1550231 RepID=A0A1G7JYI4_9ACTN|nr:hypothetical protein SAMN05660662_1783 [Blastococcus aurantiacus]